MLGTVKYDNSVMTYKPFRNYLIHTANLFDIDDSWSPKLVVIFMGGQNMPLQFKVNQTLTWNKRLWVSTMYRTNEIIGLGER
jgi:hypothetical protein